MNKALYAFSGDPITNGHIDIIERAARVFDHLVVGIGMNPKKKYLFSLEERHNMAQRALAGFKNVSVQPFKGLLIDFALEQGIGIIIRGVRNSEDLNYEMMLYQVGDSQSQEVDMFFIPARQGLMHVSSGAAKALQIEQGLIQEYVPLYTKQCLEEKLGQQYLLGLTGEIGNGKTFISNSLAGLGKEHGLEVHVIEVDRIGHDILGRLTEPVYAHFRRSVAEEFGSELLDQAGFIDRQALGRIIFDDIGRLKRFNSMIYQPLLLRLRRELYGLKGLIILDSALIVETEMAYLCNNNIVLVNCSKDVQLKRLKERSYTAEQIDARLKSQFTNKVKKELIESNIARDNCGRLFEIDTDREDPASVERLFTELSDFYSL